MVAFHAHAAPFRSSGSPPGPARVCPLTRHARPIPASAPGPGSHHRGRQPRFLALESAARPAQSLSRGLSLLQAADAALRDVDRRLVELRALCLRAAAEPGRRDDRRRRLAAGLAGLDRLARERAFEGLPLLAAEGRVRVASATGRAGDGLVVRLPAVTVATLGLAGLDRLDLGDAEQAGQAAVALDLARTLVCRHRIALANQQSALGVAAMAEEVGGSVVSAGPLGADLADRMLVEAAAAAGAHPKALAGLLYLLD